MALGLTITAGRIGELRRRLNEHARSVLKSADLQRAVRVDGVVRLDEFDTEMFEALAKLEPWGQDNPSSAFAVLGVRRRGEARVVGKKHLKFQVTDGETTVEAIWWGMEDVELPAGAMDVAFVPEL